VTKEYLRPRLRSGGGEGVQHGAPRGRHPRGEARGQAEGIDELHPVGMILVPPPHPATWTEPMCQGTCKGAQCVPSQAGTAQGYGAV